jgi:IS30 family transposase
MYTPGGHHLTQETRNRIVDLSGQGHGPTAIARQIGGGLTKNTVSTVIAGGR